MDVFCLCFAVLGGALLFLSSKQTTVGSVVMVAAISGAVANSVGDSDVTKRSLIDFCANEGVPSTIPAAAVAKLCAFKALQSMPFGGVLTNLDA
jgi:hypothetical protein